MALSVEDFIAKYAKEGEEHVVGDNLTMNRGPISPDDMHKLEADAPEGTIFLGEWSFGDEIQRMWFNPEHLFVFAFSQLSHSFHSWRYPNKITYISQVTDVGKFFEWMPFDGTNKLKEAMDNPETSEDYLNTPIRDLITIKDEEKTVMVFGPILDLTLADLQTEVMMDRLAL